MAAIGEAADCAAAANDDDDDDDDVVAVAVAVAAAHKVRFIRIRLPVEQNVRVLTRLKWHVFSYFLVVVLCPPTLFLHYLRVVVATLSPPSMEIYADELVGNAVKHKHLGVVDKIMKLD